MERNKSIQNNEDEGPHVDSILHELNAKGRYQILHFLTLLLSTLAASFQLFSNVFTVSKVVNECAGPPFTSSWADAFEGIDKYGVSIINNVSVIEDQCSLSLVVNTSNVVEKTGCIFGNEYMTPKDKSAMSEFDLVCDYAWLASLSQTAFILGQGFGAVFTTILSDRYGRKIVLVGSNLGMLIGGIGIAYSPNVAAFITFKFIEGGLQQGVVTAITTMTLELFPTSHRSISTWGLGFDWSLVNMLFPLISYFLQDESWRFLQLAYTSASLVALFQWWYLDESLRWLLANGKAKRAAKVIKRIARLNKTNGESILKNFHIKGKLTDNELQKNSILPKKTIAIEATQRLTFLDIFRVRRLLLNALVLWFGWFTTALSFFTIYLTSTSLSGNPHLNFALVALMETPSNIFFYFYLNKLGRRFCMQIMFGTLGIGLLLAGVFKTLEEGNSIFSTFTTLSWLLSMNGASGCFTIVFAYTPEMFPTNVRNQAIGVSSFVGRIGGMLAPFAGLLAEQAVWAPGLICGILAITVCILVRFLPETAGRELPQTLEELQTWFKKGVNSKHIRDSLDQEISL